MRICILLLHACTEKNGCIQASVHVFYQLQAAEQAVREMEPLQTYQSKILHVSTNGELRDGKQGTIVSVILLTAISYTTLDEKEMGWLEN